MENATQSYGDWLQEKYDRPNGQLNSFLSLRDQHLYLCDLDLTEQVQHYGTPLELVYTPLINDRVRQMIDWFAEARAATHYPGGFIYANASKANVAEEVIRHAIIGGAHYETSSSYDIDIARLLWQHKVLPGDRLIINNGFKLGAYADNIKQLRREGHTNVVPVFDSPQEIDLFADFELPLTVGLRQRIDHTVTKRSQLGRVESRFGMPFSELSAQADRLAKLPNLSLQLYHAMIGSQLEDEARFLQALLVATECYCDLKAAHPSLTYFDFGGGMPVPYSLHFDFDYRGFAQRLLAEINECCQQRGVDPPTIIGEFGRYTSAEHGAHLFQVLEAKPTAHPDASWYIIDSSLMVSLPDTWGLNQKFIVLPLNGYDRPTQKVWLGGLTCDSDDFYQEDGTPGYLTLPEFRPDEPLYLGFFSTGAYQEMLSGVRGVHHCLLPEAKEVIIERDPATGKERRRVIQGQSSVAILDTLGYDRYPKLQQS